MTYDGASGLTFKYTPNGETKEIKSPTKTSTYNYDALGNLLSVSIVQGTTTTTVEYLVDGKGRRVGKKLNGVLQQQWLYGDDLRPVAELSSSGALVAQFIYGSKSNVPDYVKRFSPAATYRIVTDVLGSPRLAVNVANGNIQFKADYSTFGVATGTGLSWMPFGFAGGIYDPHTELVRFGARDYNPAIGRWMSKDPIRFDGDGPNLYVYGLNDPVNSWDPSGHGTGGCIFALGRIALACPECVTSGGLAAPMCLGCFTAAIQAAGSCQENRPPPPPPGGGACGTEGNGSKGPGGGYGGRNNDDVPYPGRSDGSGGGGRDSQ
jgi:RHS repeat-associated protein